MNIQLPIAPKLLPKLDRWAGEIASDIELSECVADDVDFATVRRLDVEGCELVGIQLLGARLARLHMSDASLTHLEAAGMAAPETAWLRVLARSCRCTGADFGAGLFEDCAFVDTKFDEAGLRATTLKRVRFENCTFKNADFSGAKLFNVSFASCDLEGCNFDRATCSSVDLRGQNVTLIKGVSGLRGATITSEQLMQLAPLLASDMNLKIDDEY